MDRVALYVGYDDATAGALGKITSIEASEHIAPYHGAFFMRDWRRYARYNPRFVAGFARQWLRHSLVGSATE